MWDLPAPGIEPLSPALAGGFFTTGPPGKPQASGLSYNCCHTLNSVVNRAAFTSKPEQQSNPCPGSCPLEGSTSSPRPQTTHTHVKECPGIPDIWDLVLRAGRVGVINIHSWIWHSLGPGKVPVHISCSLLWNERCLFPRLLKFVCWVPANMRDITSEPRDNWALKKKPKNLGVRIVKLTCPRVLRYYQGNIALHQEITFLSNAECPFPCCASCSHLWP